MPRTSTIELPRILAAAARRVLNGAGPAGVTYRAVAAEAGVTVRSIQNRFGSMAGLLDYVAVRGFAELSGAIMTGEGVPLTEVGPPADTLATALDRYRRWAVANPELHRLMFDAPAHCVTPSPTTRRAAADLFGLFAGAARSRDDGHRAFAEMHGRVQLALSGLCPGGPSTIEF